MAHTPHPTRPPRPHPPALLFLASDCALAVPEPVTWFSVLDSTWELPLGFVVELEEAEEEDEELSWRRLRQGPGRREGKRGG